MAIIIARHRRGTWSGKECTRQLGISTYILGAGAPKLGESAQTRRETPNSVGTPKPNESVKNRRERPDSATVTVHLWETLTRVIYSGIAQAWKTLECISSASLVGPGSERPNSATMTMHLWETFTVKLCCLEGLAILVLKAFVFVSCIEYVGWLWWFSICDALKKRWCCSLCFGCCSPPVQWNCNRYNVTKVPN